MFISDLEHLEVVAEANNAVGGTCGKHIKPARKKHKPQPPTHSAETISNADALAQGQNTFTQTTTDAVVIAGQFSGLPGRSIARASGAVDNSDDKH